MAIHKSIVEKMEMLQVANNTARLLDNEVRSYLVKNKYIIEDNNGESVFDDDYVDVLSFGDGNIEEFVAKLEAYRQSQKEVE